MVVNLKKTGLDDHNDDKMFEEELLTWRQVGKTIRADPKRERVKERNLEKKEKKLGTSLSREKEALEDYIEEEGDTIQ